MCTFKKWVEIHKANYNVQYVVFKLHLFSFLDPKSSASQGPAVASNFIMRIHKKFDPIVVHLPHFVCLFLVSISWRLTTFQFSGPAEYIETLGNGDFPHLTDYP